jgi:hypothetical protein
MAKLAARSGAGHRHSASTQDAPERDLRRRDSFLGSSGGVAEPHDNQIIADNAIVDEVGVGRQAKASNTGAAGRMSSMGMNLKQRHNGQKTFANAHGALR